MVTKFDHNLVVAGKPSTKVTLGLSPSFISLGVILDICQVFLCGYLSVITRQIVFRKTFIET